MNHPLYEPLDADEYPQSEQYKRATELLLSKDGDPWVAWKLLHEAHEQGDPRASYGIAAWYIFTYPPVVNRKSFKKAVEFLRPAVEAAIPHAFHNYAMSLDLGKGIEQNEEEAFKYYLLAFAHGCDQAIEDIARCYHHGNGVPKDRDIAQVWFRRGEALGISDEEDEE